MQEEANLSLMVSVAERLFVSGLGRMTDKEVFFPLGMGYRTVCVLEKLQVMLSLEGGIEGKVSGWWDVWEGVREARNLS